MEDFFAAVLAAVFAGVLVVVFPVFLPVFVSVFLPGFLPGFLEDDGFVDLASVDFAVFAAFEVVEDGFWAGDVF